MVIQRSVRDVSLFSMARRDRLSQTILLLPVALCLVGALVVLVPSPRHKSNTATSALTMCAAAFIASWGALFVRYAVIAHHFKRVIPVKGRQVSTFPCKGGYYIQYVYQYQGKTYYGETSSSSKFIEELTQYTVLLDPARPERSWIGEMFC